MNTFYQQSLEAAENELADLVKQKGQIDARIGKLRETVLALSRLIGDVDHGAALAGAVQLAESGLTESIREVLQELKLTDPIRYHLPTKIRDRLSVKGFPLAKYKNEMAAIHNTLNRLKDLGEVETGIDAERKTYYRWSGAIKPLTRGQMREANEAAEQKQTGTIRRRVAVPVTPEVPTLENTVLSRKKS